MRLVLVDDHSLFREALAHYLRQSFAGIEIVEAGTFEEALRAVEHSRPDALLTDYVMPGVNGVEGIARARERCAGVPIIVLSGNISHQEAEAAVRSGAAGVISKDLSVEALIGAIGRILAGEKFVTSPAWMGAEAESTTEQAATERWLAYGLTPREIEVMSLLVHGMADKAIARDLGIAAITVRLHLHNLFRKLGARNRVEAVRIALGHASAAAPAATPRSRS